MITAKKINNRLLKYKVVDTVHCAYIYYTLDLDRYELSISGEIASSYKWLVDTRETFIDLMKRCSKNYLLNKLFVRNVFNLEKSIEETINSIKEYGINDVNLFNDIKDIDVSSSDLYYYEVENILRNYNCNEDDVIYFPVKEYPYWGVQAIELFVKHVVPILEEV